VLKKWVNKSVRDEGWWVSGLRWCEESRRKERETLDGRGDNGWWRSKWQREEMGAGYFDGRKMKENINKKGKRKRAVERESAKVACSRRWERKGEKSRLIISNSLMQGSKSLQAYMVPQYFLA